jgi:hypothetical protein
VITVSGRRESTRKKEKYEGRNEERGRRMLDGQVGR